MNVFGRVSVVLSAVGSLYIFMNAVFRRFIIFVSVLGFLCFSAVGFAEVLGQKDGLFWIDVPEGWQWYEDTGGVKLVNPTGSHSISIDIETADGIQLDEDAVRVVRDAMSSKIQEVASNNGRPVLKTQRKVDGVFALQSGFIMSTPEGMMQATAVVFFHGRHLFTIYFQAPREFQRMEMEAIVDTIKFEAPEPEEEEPAEAVSDPVQEPPAS